MRPSEYEDRPGRTTLAVIPRPLRDGATGEVRVATGEHNGHTYIYLSLWADGDGRGLRPINGFTLRAAEARVVAGALASLEAPRRAPEPATAPIPRTRQRPAGEPVGWRDALADY